MDGLHKYIQSKLNDLTGDWIGKKSGYEQDACANLGFTHSSNRYWDCTHNNLFIEIKKGKSIWLDEIRYAEILLSQLSGVTDSKNNTITIFIIPATDKKTINKIYIVDTKKIIKFLNLTPEWCELLIKRHKEVVRSLNCQQSMTLKDVRQLADYIVE